MQLKYAKDLLAITFGELKLLFATLNLFQWKLIIALSLVLIAGCGLSTASFVQDADCAKGITFWCEHIM